MNNYALTLLLLFFGILSASIPAIVIFANAQSTQPTCTPKDESELKFLWKHNHDPMINHNSAERLPVINYCIAVTGKLLSQNVDPDGDIHMTLALDSQYQHYSNETGTRAGTIVT
ncbi:MAG TPA: hypothetical protein VN704_13230, partial [Verrucomicrobiae bacterium]|nr:hypothetical protein [Verrucomicrobiae bacterium]